MLINTVLNRERGFSSPYLEKFIKIKGDK